MNASNQYNGNRTVYWLVNVLLILIFTSNLMSSMTELFQVDALFQLMGWSWNLLTIIVFFLQMSKGPKQSNKGLFGLYLIFMLYCIHYIYISPQMPRVYMLGVPVIDSILIKSAIRLTMLLWSIPIIMRFADWKLFSRVLFIITALYFPIYFSNIDISFYVLNALNELTGDDLYNSVPLGFIEPFTLAYTSGLSIVCAIYLLVQNRESNIIIKVLLYAFIVLFIYGLIVAGKRGPVLMIAVTVISYLFIKSFISKKILFVLLVGSLIVYLSIENIVILMMSSDFASGFIDRVLSTSDNGGTGRYGSNDSVFAVAIRQFLESPIFGSNFRLLKQTQYGSGLYPHNFVIEFLITFGAIFSIPIFIYFWRASKQAYLFMKSGISNLLPTLMFTYFALCKLVSGSIFLSYEFWIPFFMLYYLSTIYKEEFE